jgi:hypothetical protein
MLLVMLGAVLLMMRQVQQPAAIEFFDRVFGDGAARPAKRPGTGEPRPIRIASVSTVDSPESDAGEKDDRRGAGERPVRRSLDEALWEPVKDNAIFLPVEQPAWFSLLRQAQSSTPAELAAESMGDVTYAQLIDQPDVYRGQVVTTKGYVVRESIKPAPENDFGIRDLHQLIVAPRGGGEWPIVVYALTVPDGFPRGDGLREAIVVEGFYFKNWSFPYDGGMGLAPVIVAASIEWRRATSSAHAADAAAVPERGELTTEVIGGAAAALGAAALFVVWAARQTRRPRRAAGLSPDLSGLESDE